MKTITFTVVRKLTGDERARSMEVGDDFTPENVYFLFGDGNYGCDCNRHIQYMGERQRKDKRCGKTLYGIKNLKLDGVDVMEYMVKEYGDNVEPI